MGDRGPKKVNVLDPAIMHVEAVATDRTDPPGLWVHTHGLARLGQPELEIRSVCPSYFVLAAVSLLNSLASEVANAERTCHAGDKVNLFGLALQLVSLPPVVPSHDGYLTLVAASPIVAPATAPHRGEGGMLVN